MLLIKAVLEERFRQAKYLLTVGMDANQRDFNRKSALIHACQLGNPKMRIAFTKLLLHHGASASIRDNANRNAVSWSCCNGDLDVFECILSHCDSTELGLDDPDKQGNTPLNFACASGNVELVRKLCEELDNVGIRKYRGMRNWYGYTPLLTAFKSGNFEIAKYLLKTDEDGNGSQEILRYIMSNREKFEHCQEYSSEVELLAKLVLDLPEEESKSLTNIVYLLLTSDSFRALAMKNKKRELKMQSMFHTPDNNSDKSEISNSLFILPSSQYLPSVRSRGIELPNPPLPRTKSSSLEAISPRLSTRGSSKDILPMLMNLRVEQMSDAYRSSYSLSKITSDEVDCGTPKKTKRRKTLLDASKQSIRDIRARKGRGNSFSIARPRGWSVLKEKIDECGPAKSNLLTNNN